MVMTKDFESKYCWELRNKILHHSIYNTVLATLFYSIQKSSLIS